MGVPVGLARTILAAPALARSRLARPSIRRGAIASRWEVALAVAAVTRMSWGLLRICVAPRKPTPPPRYT